jgi:23S rRNA pseudouridine2605 synthase
MAQERLQKILAAAGVASRRKAEELITAGRISVNGEKITQLGTKADARNDEIRLDGQLLRGPERHVYIVLYKPKGYVTTVSDPEGRPVVLDLLKGVEARVFPVGRLDYASEGLLLLTNDGELMQQLTKTAAHVPKTYQVKVSGTPTEEEIDKLRGGIHLPPETSRAGTMGGTRPGMPRRTQSEHTLPAKIDLVRHQDNPWYEVTLTEGRNRQIRRMFEQIGHHVEKIKRVRYGALRLDVEPGKWRLLKPREVEALRNPKPLPAASARSGEGGERAFSSPRRAFSPPAKAFSTPGPPVGARGGYRPGTPIVHSSPEQRPQSHEQRPSPTGTGSPERRSGPPAGRARSEDRGFSRPDQDQQRPESRRPERPFKPRREFGSAHDRPSRPEPARGGADRGGPSGARPFDKQRGPSGRGAAGRTGSTGFRPFDKTRGPKGPARGEQRPSRTPSGPPARRAGSTDREFFSRPRQDRSESRRPERPSRQEFGSSRERPSRPERAHGGPDRRGSTGAKPFDKARGSGAGKGADRRGSTGARPFDKPRGSKGPARGEGKFPAADRRPSRTPGRYPRNKSGGKPGR